MVPASSQFIIPGYFGVAQKLHLFELEPCAMGSDRAVVICATTTLESRSMVDAWWYAGTAGW